MPPLTPNGPPPDLPFLLVCRGGGSPQAVVVAQDGARWAVHAIAPSTGKLMPPSASSPSGTGRIVHAAKLTPLAPAEASVQLLLQLYP